jgi:hypothetical protein
VTPTGVRPLAAAKLKVRELFGELFEDDAEPWNTSGPEQAYAAPSLYLSIAAARACSLDAMLGCDRSPLYQREE